MNAEEIIAERIHNVSMLQAQSKELQSCNNYRNQWKDYVLDPSGVLGSLEWRKRRERWQWVGQYIAAAYTFSKSSWWTQTSWHSITADLETSNSCLRDGKLGIYHNRLYLFKASSTMSVSQKKTYSSMSQERMHRIELTLDRPWANFCNQFWARWTNGRTKGMTASYKSQ